MNSPRWSVNDTEARLLSELFRNLLVLEIGTGLGISTRGLAETARFVYTVDIDPWVEREVAPTLPENVKFCNNIDNVPDLLDGAFIDGLHSLNQCRKDIVAARNKVKPGGILVFHDTRMMPIIDAICESGMQGVMIHTSAGMGLYWNGDHL